MIENEIRAPANKRESVWKRAWTLQPWSLICPAEQLPAAQVVAECGMSASGSTVRAVLAAGLQSSSSQSQVRGRSSEKDNKVVRLSIVHEPLRL